MFSKNWLIVGVSGATCSGKTTLVNKLKENLKDAVVFHQDLYFYPENDPRHVRVTELNHNNWELVSAVDMNKLHTDVLNVIQQNNTDQKSRRALILDGFLIFNYKPLSDLCDLRYFIYLTKEVCSERRNKRSYDPPDVPGYFDKVVWPEYERHYDEIVKNTELKNTIKFFDGTLPPGEIFQNVITELKNKLNSDS